MTSAHTSAIPGRQFNDGLPLLTQNLPSPPMFPQAPLSIRCATNPGTIHRTHTLFTPEAIYHQRLGTTSHGGGGLNCCGGLCGGDWS
jgi:hypothetical protein